MKLPITNIEYFEIVKVFGDRWKSIIKNKIYEYICPLNYYDDYDIDVCIE